MIKRIVAFVEGPNPDGFWPLSVSHSPYLLRCGVFRLWEKWVQRLRPDETLFFVRSELAPVMTLKTDCPVNRPPESSEADLWLLDGRWLGDAVDFKPESIAGKALLAHGERVVGARVPLNDRAAKPLIDWLHSGAVGEIPQFDLDPHAVTGEIIDHLWDVVDQNPAQILADFNWISGGQSMPQPLTKVHETAVILKRQEVIIGEDAELGPQTVLDARAGPIIIGRNAVINPHTYVEGPAVIAAQSRLYGGKIRAGTTIGPGCRVGGEVEASVFLGSSNKYHDGFLGHSVVGEWVNLGALTTNSDLKNNYHPVRVELPGGTVDTGRIKIGAYLADHTKTGIGTLLPTGVTVGFAANIFGGGGGGCPQINPGICLGWNGKFYRISTGEGQTDGRRSIQPSSTPLYRRGTTAV